MSDELIVKLNELRRAFSDKGSTSNTGKLYNAFKKKLTAANKAVTEGTRVTKQVVKNVKVVDAYTDTSIVEANPPFYDDVIDLTFNYGVVDEDIGHIHGSDPTEFVGAPALSLTKHLGTAMASPAVDDYSYCVYGWIFFDYDKALYESSFLAQYANMEIVLDMLGRDMLNKYFYVTSATYEEYYHYEYLEGIGKGKPYLLPSESSTTGWDWDGYQNTQLKATIQNGYKTQKVDWSENIDSVRVGYPYVVDVLGNKAYSFVLLRNFQVARDGGNDGYRIMGFEVQSWADSAHQHGSSTVYYDTDIWFTVAVTDGTAALIDELITLYTTAQTEFQTYIDDSVGGYGWNDLTNTFTDAFVTEQEALYEGSEELAPWNLIPWYYFLFVELLSGTFNGDLDAISAAASAISSEVAPASGTKDLILAFQEKLDGLYDDYLSPGTKWGEASANATTQDKNKEYSNTWPASDLFPVSTNSAGSTNQHYFDPYEYPIDQLLDSTTAYAKSADDTVVSVTKAEVWAGLLSGEEGYTGYHWVDVSLDDTNLGTSTESGEYNIWPTAVDAYASPAGSGQNATAFRIYFDGPLYYYVDNVGDGTDFEITALEDGQTFTYTGWVGADGPGLDLTDDGAIAVESQYFSVAINSATGPSGPSWWDASDRLLSDEELGIVATYNGDASAGDTGEYYFEIIINGGLWAEGMDWESGSPDGLHPWQAALIFNPDPRGYWATRSDTAADDASAKANYAGWELDDGGQSTMLVNAAGEQLNLGVLDSYDIPIEPATDRGDTTNAVQIEWTFGAVDPAGNNIGLTEKEETFEEKYDK